MNSPVLAAQPPPLSHSNGFNSENKVNPSVLLVIIIVAIIFFVSGLLHLLVRFLWTSPLQRHHENPDNVTAFQGQLQQLFHLHDSGVDQSFIDNTLPVFHYKSITGSKSPFDCAVCLCEFDPEDKLRLLPKCSHAFHIECIDTWLFSHSTCPLCRSSLLPSHRFPCTPVVLVLESESEISTTNTISLSNSQMGFRGDGEFDDGSSEIGKLEDLNSSLVRVKLGKYKNVDAGESSSSKNKNVDSRRCFSMGSVEYVMDENSSLKVAIKAAKTEKVKTESFSVSKIWLRGKNVRESSRRAVSFRFPNNGGDRIGVSRWENEREFDEENQSSCSFDSQLNQSFAKRTLLWLMGKQSKVSHFESSSPSSSVSNI